MQKIKTHTVFTLMDGSKHDTMEAALNHCEEMMGAGTRDMLYAISATAQVARASLDLVVEKKYDKAILSYVSWRDQHNQLLKYEEESDE